MKFEVTNTFVAQWAETTMHRDHIVYTPHHTRIREGQIYWEVWSGLPPLEFVDVDVPAGRGRRHRSAKNYVWLTPAAVRAYDERPQSLLTAMMRKTRGIHALLVEDAENASYLRSLKQSQPAASQEDLVINHMKHLNGETIHHPHSIGARESTTYSYPQCKTLDGGGSVRLDRHSLSPLEAEALRRPIGSYELTMTGLDGPGLNWRFFPTNTQPGASWFVDEERYHHLLDTIQKPEDFTEVAFLLGSIRTHDDVRKVDEYLKQRR